MDREVKSRNDIHMWVRLLKVKITQIEIVLDRGFIIDDDEETLLSYYNVNNAEHVSRLETVISELDSGEITEEERQIRLEDEDEITPEEREFVYEFRNNYLGKFLEYVNNLNRRIGTKSKEIRFSDDPRPLLTRTYTSEDGTRMLYCYYMPIPKGGGDHKQEHVIPFSNNLAQKQKNNPLQMKWAILIGHRNITTKNVLSNPDVAITFFIENEIVYNPTQSIFYSQHVKQTEEEMKETTTSAGVNKIKLPLMQKTEAISKYFSYKENEIVTIYRENRFVPTPNLFSIQYRTVAL